MENVFTSTFVATWSDLEGTRTLRANDAEVMDVQWRNVQELQKQVLESSDNNITDWLKWEIEALDILQLAKRHTNTATTTTATATTTN